MAQERVTKTRPQGGFTLIEVMIAILLTALTVIGVIALFRVESRASVFSRRETEAAMLAQDKFEQLRALTPPSASTTVTENDLDVQGAAGSGMFDRTSEITSLGNELYMVKITVSWDDDGFTRSVVLNGQLGGT